MPRRFLPIVKGSLAFLLGLAFWWTAAVPYAAVMAIVTEPLIHLLESPNVTDLYRQGTEITIDRSDFPPQSPRPGLRLMDLTFNQILLFVLFSLAGVPLRDANILRFLSALLLLFCVHIAAVIANIQSIYALRLGPWSLAHYSQAEANFWGAVTHFYLVVGAIAAPVAIWWLLRIEEPAQEERGRKRKPRARRGSPST